MPETDRFEHFQIVRREEGSLFELGRGAMGVTYKALDTNLHSPVALKVINAKYLNNEIARDRFLREARATAQLRHRNVASVFHLGSSGENCFYAMEFIDGITVDAMVRREGPLELEQALRITLQVARALVAAERHQLVHRDIKPSNLMLVAEDGELVVKVIDFGLARPANSVPEGGFQGSPQFASPEQIEQRPTDSRSDIYSLGATLWFMLTGRPLFSGNIHEVFEQQISKPPPIDLIRNFPAQVVSLVESMLAKDPGKRPPTAADLRSRVEQCIDTLKHTGSSVALMLDEHGHATVHPTTAGATQALKPSVGSLLAGRYRITKDLGIRSAGRVFQTVDTQTKRAICVNLLDPELEQFAGGFLQIQEDATRLKIQGHTNLLQVFNVQVNEGIPLLAVEWANGFPLIDLLRVRGKIKPAECLPILIQAARAVDFCAENQYRGLLIGLNQILVHFPGNPLESEQIAEILKLPMNEWPPYLVKLHALGPSRQDIGSFTWDGGATLDTFSRGDTSIASGDLRSTYLKCLAEVAYELFGGLRGVGGYASASDSVRYTPLPALSEQGNAALRRALASRPGAAGFDSSVQFVDAVRVAIEADYAPTAAAPRTGATTGTGTLTGATFASGPALEDPDVTIEIDEKDKHAGQSSYSPSVTVSPSSRTAAPLGSLPKPGDPGQMFKAPTPTSSSLTPAIPATPPVQKKEPAKEELAPARPAPTPPVRPQEPEPEPAPQKSGVPILVILAALGVFGIVGGLVVFRFIKPQPGLIAGSPTPVATPLEATPEVTPAATPTIQPTLAPTPEPTPVPTPSPTPRPVPTAAPTPSRVDQFELALAALSSSGGDLIEQLPRIVALAAQFTDVDSAKVSIERTLSSLHAAELPAEKLESVRPVLEKLAAEGSAGAMLNLGDLAREKSPAEASDWYQKAAAAGSSSAMAQIGLMLARTTSVPDHLKKAISWFEKSAAANDPEGQFLLAECYYYGNGTKKDPEKAVSLLRASVEGGNTRAMDLLGAYYVAAPPPIQDLRKAAELFDRAQQRGNLNALANLGVLYVKGQVPGSPADPARAREMFQRGAEAGNPACMYFYGACYEDGIGVERDMAEAKRWYIKAAKGGNPYAVQWCKENSVKY